MKLEILEDTFQKIKRDLEKMGDVNLIQAYIGELGFVLEDVQRYNYSNWVKRTHKILEKSCG